MTIAPSTVRSVVALATAALLVALGLVLAIPTRARAAYPAEVFASYSNCLVGCDSQQSTCNSGCCFLFLCGKKCLNSCQSAETVCQEGCSNTYFGSTNDGAFFDEASLSSNGRSIRLGGPFQCPEAAVGDLAVSVTQSGNGALATGSVRIACPAGETTFSVDANAIGAATFRPLGKVQACGTARIQTRDLSLDAFQWCREVTLVPAGVDLQDEE